MPAIIRNFGKLNAIVLFGAAMTLGLFYSMQLLVMTEQGVPQVKSRTIFPDITLPEIQLEIIRETPRPEKPEEPPVLPDLNPVMPIEGPPVVAGPGLPIDKPVIEDPGAYLGPTDSNAMPIAQIQPQYPTRAAQNGTEGFVIIQFDVNENGGVFNTEVLVSVPDGVFDRASLRAIERWRYQPRIVDGKAIPMRGLQTRFSFNLEE